MIDGIPAALRGRLRLSRTYQLLAREVLSSFIAAALVPTLGCGAHRADPAPIAECTECDALIARCGGTGTVSAQAIATAKTDADRERLRQLCAVNVRRLRSACR